MKFLYSLIVILGVLAWLGAPYPRNGKENPVICVRGPCPGESFAKICHPQCASDERCMARGVLAQCVKITSDVEF